MVNAQPPCRVHCLTPVRGSFSCEEQSSFRSSRHTETAVGMIPCQHWPEYWYEPAQLADSNSPTYLHRQGDCQENGPSQTPANYIPQANYYNSKWSPGDREYVAVGNESNGGVVASVLALGIGCMLMCSMWAIVRLLPFLFVPVIFYYRRNGRNAFGSAWEFGEKVFKGNGTEGSPEPTKKLLIDNLSMEDVTLRERMTALESQNEQLLKELRKQREATQLLLKQFDDFAPRTCTTCGAESKAEVSESRSFDFDE
ncbi:unnamed protein product [Nippostrongylus brasiliensis]|uniref:Transmembrane protein n=1 Tax=Nippostrongylus brasiliensis TaxID=27835 RepID=A0A0N4XJ07_NIPBR|nr:unnamed protein product [Nippostrongylus brasiliensis]